MAEHKSPRPTSLISKRYKTSRPWLRFRRGSLSFPSPMSSATLFNDEIVVRTPTGERSTSIPSQMAGYFDPSSAIPDRSELRECQISENPRTPARRSKNRLSAFDRLTQFPSCDVRPTHCTVCVFREDHRRNGRDSRCTDLRRPRTGKHHGRGSCSGCPQRGVSQSRNGPRGLDNKVRLNRIW